MGYWSGSNFSLNPSTCTSGTTVPEQLTLLVTGPRGSSESTDFVVSGSGQIIVAPSVQLDAPTITGVTAPDSTSGVLAVTYATSSNAPSGQTYTANACLDAAMTMMCVKDTSYASGSFISGLIAGTTYYVTVSADASTGYLAATSAQSSALTGGTSTMPTISSVTSSTTSAGAIVVSYVGLTSPLSGQSYAVAACTDSSMTSNCVQQSPFASGATLDGLVSGDRYYVTLTVTALASSGYLASTSAVSNATSATTQLSAPSITSTSSPSTGTATITYSASPNAPSGQNYRANVCTNSSMTTGCLSVNAYVSGATITGLSSATAYYVTVTATASSGYLASTSSVKSVNVT